MVLVAFNMIAPLFFITHVEAQVTLAALFAGMIIMTVLTAVTGFTRLLGLGHFLWFILVPFLWTRLDSFPVDGIMGWWIRGVIAVNALSLVIDVTDVVRYLAGDRTDTMAAADEKP